MNNTETNDTFELQPKISLNFNNPLIQLGVGYRKLYRDNTLISGATSKEKQTDAYDLYGDLSLRIGVLPDMRARYSKRGNTSRDNVVGKTSDANTDEFRASVSDRIFGVAINANYMIQNIKDKIMNSTSKLQQATLQASYDFSVGEKIRMGLRHDMSITKSESTSIPENTTEDQSVNISQAKVVINPIKRSAVTLNYVYKTEKNDTTSTISPSTSKHSVDKRFTANAAYAFPKYLGFRGSYANRNFETGNAVNESNVYLGAVDFKHHIKKITMRAHYDTRIQQTTVTNKNSGVQTDSELQRDKLNLVIGYDFSKSLRFTVADAYQKTDNNGETTKNTRYRFGMEVGPWHGLRLNPYVDYSQTVNASGSKGTSTNMVVQMAYIKRLHDKLDLSFTDNYRKNLSSSGGTTRETETNSATLRLSMPNVLKNMNMAIDATYTTNKSQNRSSDTTAINYRMNWFNIPHSVSLNLGYRTGSNAVDSYTLAASYGLSWRMKEVSCGIAANYSYAQTMSTPTSSSQTIYISLSIRK